MLQLGVVARSIVGVALAVAAALVTLRHCVPSGLVARFLDALAFARDVRRLEDHRLRRLPIILLTGIVGVLHDACTRADLPSASLWAAVPAYASQVPSPKATLALVERSCEILGTPGPVARLRQEADDYDNRVTAFVADDSDLIGYVARLESMSDAGELDDDYDDEYFDDDDDEVIGGELSEDPETVDSDELMAEVERFLRDQRDDG